MNKNFKKNQKVYLRKLEFNKIIKDIIETNIKIVGRKYITTVYHDLKFNIEDGDEHRIDGLSPNYKLYFSKEELEKELERLEKENFLLKNFHKITFQNKLEKISNEDLNKLIFILNKYI